MCVVALALHQHPDWPILLVGNRDEFHARASAPLAVWEDGSGIIAGRDLVGGGTWLGVHPALARLVVVTNVRSEGPPDPEKASRGALVRDALTGTGDFADPGRAALNGFNGFTLLRLIGGEAAVLTNRPDPAITLLCPGVHAIANEPSGSPCPRAEKLAGKVQQWLEQSIVPPEALLDSLTDTSEPALFLRSDHYGTRCSTLVAIDQSGQGRIIERRFGPMGTADGEAALDFSIARPTRSTRSALAG